MRAYPRADSASVDHVEDEVVRCLVTLTQALLRYGLPAHRVEEAATRLGTAFGVRFQVLGLPTTVALSVRRGASSELHIVRARPEAMDLARLDGLHSIVGRVERGELDARDALAWMNRTLDAPHQYAFLTRALAGGLVAAGAVPAFRGGSTDAIVAFVLGVVVSAAMLGFARASHRAPVMPAIASLVVALATTRIAHAVSGIHPLVVSLSTLLVLLPGMSVTMATVELATGHWVSGTSRLVGASVVFLEIGFGMLVGARFGALGAIAPTVAASPHPFASAIGAMGVAVGFGVLGNARPADAFPHLLVSGAAYGVVRSLAPWGAELASFGAALVVGLLGHAFARRLDRPSSILLVPGTTMLVPGSLGMVGVASAITYDGASALVAVVRLATTALALGTGLMVATAVLPPRTSL